VTGFWLSEWITRQNFIKLLFTFNKIQRLLSDDHQTAVHKRVSLVQFQDGIDLYLSNMTAGKIIVKPGDFNR
jgi:hypothetical protein